MRTDELLPQKRNGRVTGFFYRTVYVKKTTTYGQLFTFTAIHADGRPIVFRCLTIKEAMQRIDRFLDCNGRDYNAKPVRYVAHNFQVSFVNWRTGNPTEQQHEGEADDF